MSKVIYKFPIGHGACRAELTLPKDSLILDVEVQHGVICLWALVDPDAPKVNRSITVIGTGFHIHEEKNVSLCFIKTVHVKPFVWHVFEEFTHVPAIK